MYLFFYDLNVTIEKGLEFTASGLIDSKWSKDKANVSGKDYCVSYITPFGDIYNDWRDASEIKSYTVEHSDYINLKFVISQLDKAQSANWR